MNKLLLALLLVSIGLNIYLLQSDHDQALKQSKPTAKSSLGSAAEFVEPGSAQSNSGLNVSIKRNSEPVEFDHQQIEIWFAAKRYDLAQQAINQYLRQYPQDSKVLILEARLVEQTESVSVALNHYYQLLDRHLEDDQLGWLLNRIQHLAQTNIEKLSNLRAWDILATFIEPLWQFEPTNRNYIISLSEAYARQHMDVATENVLASLPIEDKEAIRIRALLNKAEKNSSESLAGTMSDQEQLNSKIYTKGIRLQNIGDHYIAGIYTSMQRFELMIDTGASTTTINQAAFNRLKTHGITFIGNYNINTAGGRVEAPVYRLKQLFFAGEKLQDVAIVVLPMDNLLAADGLLGMNILKHFDFKLDQQQQTLWLTRR